MEKDIDKNKVLLGVRLIPSLIIVWIRLEIFDVIK